MLVNEFDYYLPQELIAQHPAEPRDHSRLMVLDRQSETIQGHFFYELPDFFEAGDLLVFNNTRVIPARLFAVKEEGGGAPIEVFLLKQVGAMQWECLTRPGKKAKVGSCLRFDETVRGRIVAVLEDGNRNIEFTGVTEFREWLSRHGETPLPPYITEKIADPSRYQTIYACREGSVAAPTAGLHFTKGLLEKLKTKGVALGFLTLNIGLGTFRPVKTELVEDHLMHSESFAIAPDLIAQIAETKRAGKKVIAVGTTVVRVLESQAAPDGRLRAGEGETAIFIYPGYKFKVIDGLVTNFHLPRSTLLMLVAALAGREFILEGYKQAVDEKYRFFSFGDAMLIL